MSVDLTAIICTHNPRGELLDKTLAALRAQHPVEGSWELILLDNASDPQLEGRIDLSWHPAARHVAEPRLGLTHARLRSFHEAAGEILVYIDDDNILDPDYLRQALAAMRGDAQLGALGGKSIPRYEAEPPPWFTGLGISLACQDLGDAPLSASWSGAGTERVYPACAPVGAGMVIRRSAYAAYVAAAQHDAARTSLGRRGADLASGEDNDMILSLLDAGWKVGYAPQLRLEHLIPARRVTRDYLAAYAYSSSRTWVQVLDVHGIRPWRPLPRWSAPLRKARAYVAMSAWRASADYVRWRGACGMLDGRAALAPGSRP